MASLETSEGDFIKGFEGTATYYELGGQWFGSLDAMQPLQGYMLRVEQSSDLIYPNFGPDDYVNDDLARSRKLPPAISEWGMNPHAYEFDGAITMSIDNREDFDGDYIGAFVGEECRGVAERMYFPINNSYIYIIQVYSNIDEGEEITFKYYDSVHDEIIEYSETFSFAHNMVVGDGINTFGLRFIIPTELSLSSAYPNPFNPTTTLSFALPMETEVSLSIYNLQGREVSTLISGNIDAGYHSVVWNANQYSSGMYFVKMVADEYVQTQKLMLVK